MEKNKIISDIYKILLLFEDVEQKSGNVAEDDYIRYLNRLYVYWLGAGREDIYNIIIGLRKLGVEAEHDTVKSMVFHMITLLGGRNNCGA